MTTSSFVDEITSFLTERIPNLSNIIILGDFNINTMETTSVDDTIFSNTMAALRLEQHIHSPTHKLRNTLDLIFTQLHGDVKVTNATTHGYISDHCMVSFDLQLHKLRYLRQKKMIRDKTRITAKALLTIFTALILDPNDSLDQACNRLNTELHNALEQTIPLKTIKYPDKPRQPWFNKYQRPTKNSKIKTEGMEQIQTTSSLDDIHQREKHIKLTNGIPQTANDNKENT